MHSSRNQSQFKVPVLIRESLPLGDLLVLPMKGHAQSRVRNRAMQMAGDDHLVHQELQLTRGMRAMTLAVRGGWQ